MLWIAPSEKGTNSAALEKRLWDAADHLRANSGLKSEDYSAPVVGLISLRFAEVHFAARCTKLEKTGAFSRRGSQIAVPSPPPELLVRFEAQVEPMSAAVVDFHARSKTSPERAICCCRGRS